MNRMNYDIFGQCFKYTPKCEFVRFPLSGWKKCALTCDVSAAAGAAALRARVTHRQTDRQGI